MIHASDTTIAVLYVDPKGPYANMQNVDVWDVSRDARKYAGPFPVVAHPPCERWGRYARGGPSAKVPCELGNDGGCFKSALESVRRFGGVLEHPADSHAWHAFELLAPNHVGGWTVADFFGGWTCRVDQSNYGHKARKATWLYACKVSRLPSLQWKRGSGIRLDAGYHSAEERRAGKARGERRDIGRLSDFERRATPLAFRDVLIEMARSVCQ
jgi:hypothetical protein